MQIVLAKVAVRELEKISKGNAKQALMIRQFLGELALVKNPKNLPNGEKCKVMMMTAIAGVWGVIE